MYAAVKSFIIWLSLPEQSQYNTDKNFILKLRSICKIFRNEISIYFWLNNLIQFKLNQNPITSNMLQIYNIDKEKKTIAINPNLKINKHLIVFLECLNIPFTKKKNFIHLNFADYDREFPLYILNWARFRLVWSDTIKKIYLSIESKIVTCSYCSKWFKIYNFDLNLGILCLNCRNEYLNWKNKWNNILKYNKK